MVIKDVVKTFGVTSDTPEEYGGGSPTFDQYKGTSIASRIGADSDRPNEEAVEEDVLDGRSVQASVELAFSQMIFEESSSDTVYTTFRDASKNNTNVWLRREGVQSEAVAEILGGELGFTVTVGKQRPGQEGHRMFVVNFTAVAPFGGNTIQEESGGS